MKRTKITFKDLDALHKAREKLTHAEDAFRRVQAPISARAEEAREFVLKHKVTRKSYIILWLWPDQTHAIYVRGVAKNDYWRANLDEFDVTLEPAAKYRP